MSERTAIVPYVVPSTYPLAGGGMERALGHGLHVCHGRSATPRPINASR